MQTQRQKKRTKKQKIEMKTLDSIVRYIYFIKNLYKTQVGNGGKKCIYVYNTT